MGGHQVRQVRPGHPVDPGHPGIRRREPAAFRVILPVAHHGDDDRVVRGQQTEGFPDGGSPLQRGEQPEENHPQGSGGTVGHQVLSGAEPVVLRADRDHDGTIADHPLDRRGVFRGVDQDDVGGLQRRAVDRVERSVGPATRAGQTPVVGGARQRHQVVQDDGGAAKRQPRQPDVEMTEVADQEGVRVQAPGTPREP